MSSIDWNGNYWSAVSKTVLVRVDCRICERQFPDVETVRDHLRTWHNVPEKDLELPSERKKRE